MGSAEDSRLREERILRELEELIAKGIALRSGNADQTSAPGEPSSPFGEDLGFDPDGSRFSREFLEKSGDALFVADLFGTLRFVNRAAGDLFGFRREELVGRNVSEFLYPRDLEKTVSGMAALVRGEPIPSRELLIRSGSGDRACEISITLVKRDSYPIGVLTVARDITERREMEDALHESRARLRAVIDSLPFDFFVLDTQGRYVMQNSACRRNWGDVTGKTPADVAPDGKTLALWEENNRRALAGETTRGEVSFPVGGGERLFYQIISPILQDHRVAGVLGINCDFTERLSGEKLVRAQRDVAVAFASAPSLREPLEFCLERALDISGMDAGGIYLLEKESGDLVLHCHRNLSASFVEKVTRVEIDASTFFSSLGGRPLFTHASSGSDGRAELMLQEGLQALAIVPILHKGEAIGCMNISSRSEAAVPLTARQALETIAAQIGTAVASLQVREALRESEEKFRSLAEESPNMIFINLAGKVVYTNRACSAVMGYSPEEFLHRDFSFASLIAPEHRERVQEAFRRHRGNEEVPPYEYAVITRDGQRLETIITTKLVDYKGERAILGIVTDITERKRTEEALRESESRYRSLVEKSSEIIFTLSPGGRFTFLNPAFTALSGWAAEEWVGRSFSEIIHPDDRPAIGERFRRVLQGEALAQNEVRIMAKGGEVLTVEYTSIPIMDRGEVKRIWGVARDVTARIKAEEDRGKLAVLREREEISRWLHDHLGADLYNIILLVDGISGRDFKDPVTGQQLEWISETSRKALAGIRNYLDFSSRADTTFGGLVEHMEKYGRFLLRSLGVDFTFTRRGDMGRCAITGLQSFSVYLIYKEALTNIIKHARAQEVTVEVAVDGEHLTMNIEDDGRGFTPEGIASGKYGTMNIRARAEELGAHVAITGGAQGGTSVVFTMPLA